MDPVGARVKIRTASRWWGIKEKGDNVDIEVDRLARGHEDIGEREQLMWARL